MGEVSVPGVSLADLLAEYRKASGRSEATAEEMFGVVMAPGPAFVAPGALTLARILADYPPNAARVGMYARVSNLYGALDEIMRCRFDGVAHRWVPQREDYNGASAVTTGTVPITPLVTPPMLRLTGTLTGNITIVPQMANAYIGQVQRVIVSGTLGIYSATITGLVGSNITLLGNAARYIEYAADGWFAHS